MESSSEFMRVLLLNSRANSILPSSYGISYHGAAQSASGTKEEVKKIRDKSKSLFRNIELFGKSSK